MKKLEAYLTNLEDGEILEEELPEKPLAQIPKMSKRKTSKKNKN